MKILKINLLLIFIAVIISCGKEDSDPCKNTICFNDGQCIEGKCYCIDGFIGEDCSESPNQICSQPCQNGGTCNINTGTCDCPPNFEGPQCQYEVISCAGVACVNGQLDSNCDCNCDDGWVGVACNVAEPEIYSFIPSDIEHICPEPIGGDCESGGDLDITIRCNAFVLNGTSIYVNVYFDAWEPTQDHTHGRFEGVFWLYDVPNGKKINRIISSTTSDAYYEDRDDFVDFPTVTNGTLVMNFRVIGDTPGCDIVDVEDCNDDGETHLSRIRFNPMTIELVDD